MTEDRYVFAHTFVEAMAEFACGSAKAGYESWLECFGKPQLPEVGPLMHMDLTVMFDLSSKHRGSDT